MNSNALILLSLHFIMALHVYNNATTLVHLLLFILIPMFALNETE